MCADCDAAATKLWHGFSYGCKGCEARSVARSPEFFASMRSGTQTRQYQALLGLTGVTHDEAKAGRAADFLSRPLEWRSAA